MRYLHFPLTRAIFVIGKTRNLNLQWLKKHGLDLQRFPNLLGLYFLFQRKKITQWFPMTPKTSVTLILPLLYCQTTLHRKPIQAHTVSLT